MLFHYLNEALEAATDAGTIYLLEAAKRHEAQLVIDEDLPPPSPVSAELPCGCVSYAKCEDRDTACPERDAATSNNGDEE
jgi:hypothetical protein